MICLLLGWPCWILKNYKSSTNFPAGQLSQISSVISWEPKTIKKKPCTSHDFRVHYTLGIKRKLDYRQDVMSFSDHMEYCGCLVITYLTCDQRCAFSENTTGTSFKESCRLKIDRASS